MQKKLLIFSAIAAITVPQTIALAKAQVNLEEKKAPSQVEAKAERKQAQAQRFEDKGQIKTQGAQKRLEFESKNEKMPQDKCKNVESKISNRVNRYENNGRMLQKVYGNMETRLTRLSAQLKAAGADTTQLDADLKLLSDKIDKLYADNAAFITTLKETQTSACTATEGEFKGKIDQARRVPEVIKQGRVDIKNFFQTTIKADLQKIQAALGVQPEAIEGTEAERTTVKVQKPKRNQTTTTTTGSTTTATGSTETSTSTTPSTSTTTTTAPTTTVAQ